MVDIVAQLVLAFNFTYDDFFKTAGLNRLLACFSDYLYHHDSLNAKDYTSYLQGASLTATEESKLLLQISFRLSSFLKKLFGLPLNVLMPENHTVILNFRRHFWLKRLRGKAFATCSSQDLQQWHALLAKQRCDNLFKTNDPEHEAAQLALTLLEQAQNTPTPAHINALALAERWHAQNAAQHHDWICYRHPGNRLPSLPQAKPRQDGLIGYRAAQPHTLRQGFSLTTEAAQVNSAQVVAYEVDYCIKCHPRAKDSCRHGFFDKQKVLQHQGCPLEERISEAHQAYSDGDILAALILMMIDNPLIAGTGDRICNDCMKACIFQKQQPVNIPQIETQILKSVLAGPWGVEIFGLLTRFHPLRRQRPVPLVTTGKKVLVVGCGPAGYTLAHYLSQEGLAVVIIDGMKIEPLTIPKQPIYQLEDLGQLQGDLARRTPLGFGGVSEYGITARWDKYFLNILALTLLRNERIVLMGGVRFGGQITLKNAKSLGFDHVALCSGAGKPNWVTMEQPFPTGVRSASDFLMTLHSQVPYQPQALTSLQVELPAVVIGAGLTAVDTATEVLAYYVVQLKKLLTQVQSLGLTQVRQNLTIHAQKVFDRLWQHASQLAAEQQKPQPQIIALLQSWGGVSLLYRRTLAQSPAYRQNPEELDHAFAQGVQFIAEVQPLRCEVDEDGCLTAIMVHSKDGSLCRLAARNAFIAAGTQPNLALEDDELEQFDRDQGGHFLKAHYWQQGSLKPAAASELSNAFFSNSTKNHDCVSFFGDIHPHYAGSVVKAMASAKKGSSQVAQLLLAQTESPATKQSWQQMVKSLKAQLTARIVTIKSLAPQIIELVVRAPLAAKAFAPGQFFRLQNFTTTPATMIEPLALTGAWVNSATGEIGLIALQLGVSSTLLNHLCPGEEVMLMGPCGSPTVIPKLQKVILCGGGLGNAVLLSIGAAMRAQGCKVIYLAAYRSAQFVFCQELLEAAADQVIWCLENPDDFVVNGNRPQDFLFTGNIVAGLLALAKQNLNTQALFDFHEAEHFLTIGSDQMMAAVTRARYQQLGHLANPQSQAFVSVNAPMQCMLKAICGQCLQRQVDPITQKESFVFACEQQDQPAECVDFTFLQRRLQQNHVIENINMQILKKNKKANGDNNNLNS